MAGDDCGGQKEAMKKREVIFTILAIAIISVVIYLPSLKRKSQSITCGNYMSSIGLATRVWVEDNHNMLPDNFVVMSNELATTKVLICRAITYERPLKTGLRSRRPTAVTHFSRREYPGMTRTLSCVARSMAIGVMRMEPYLTASEDGRKSFDK
jgi:hypothetical protein